MHMSIGKLLTLINMVAWFSIVGMAWANGASENEDEVLRNVRTVLSSAHKVARIYYTAACNESAEDPVPFPRTKLQPAKDKSAAMALHKMFQNEPNVVVTEHKERIVEIKIGKISLDILRTKITSLNLDSIEQYNPSEVISAIEHTKEVQAEMQKLGVKLPLTVTELALVEPAKGKPHLPSVIKDRTVDELLDMVAVTFDGIVIYGECANAHAAKLFWIDFSAVNNSEGVN